MRGTMDGKSTVELPSVTVVQQVQLTHILLNVQLHSWNLFTIDFALKYCTRIRFRLGVQYFHYNFSCQCYCYHCYCCIDCSFQADGSGDGKKSRVTRKHVIIGVTCAVVTAMVITGVLLAVKFSLDSTAEIVKVWQQASYGNTVSLFTFT